MRPSRAVTPAALYELLDQWYDTNEVTIGGHGDHQGRAPRIWIAIGDYRCHLNADTTHDGVGELLERWRAADGGLAWHVSANQNGTFNKVTFGVTHSAIPGVYLYLRPPAAGPFRLL